jgi:Holliday junction resolvase
MRRGGAGKRRDAVEPEIIQGLRSVGAEVWQLSGNGLPDILATFRSRYFVMEIKSAGGRLTAAQRGIPWPVVRSVSDALRVIGVHK